MQGDWHLAPKQLPVPAQLSGLYHSAGGPLLSVALPRPLRTSTAAGAASTGAATAASATAAAAAAAALALPVAAALRLCLATFLLLFTAGFLGAAFFAALRFGAGESAMVLFGSPGGKEADGCGAGLKARKIQTLVEGRDQELVTRREALLV